MRDVVHRRFLAVQFVGQVLWYAAPYVQAKAAVVSLVAGWVLLFPGLWLATFLGDSWLPRTTSMRSVSLVEAAVATIANAIAWSGTVWLARRIAAAGSTWIRRVSRALVVGVAVVATLVGMSACGWTFFGRGLWCMLATEARITVGSREVVGWVHRARWVPRRPTNESAIVVTSGEGDSWTYAVHFAPAIGPTLVPCGKWIAPRSRGFFLVFDQCMPEPCPRCPSPDLVTGPGFAEFTADDGRRVRVSW
jgi:hypothetical protein